MILKQFGYYFIKYWISIALFFYYKRIRVVGVEHIPKDKPILFLSNHQNALMDILFIAIRCKRKPWYLTRADVFKSQTFRPFFQFLQMLPIYRIRDGRASLSNNKAIFKRCAALLKTGQSILLFPEANHSLKRKVRPLSKGFTRIVDAALELDPKMDLQLIPIGQNYQNPTGVGDEAAIYFGKPISVQPLKGHQNFTQEIKQAVFDELITLTTHIESGSYEDMLMQLKLARVDFTRPYDTNALLAENNWDKFENKTTKYDSAFTRFLFYLANLPWVFLWRLLLKPKVPESEFTATYRFGFVLLVYPIVYALSLWVIAVFYDEIIASILVLGHAIINLILIKIGVSHHLTKKIAFIINLLVLE